MIVWKMSDVNPMFYPATAANSQALPMPRPVEISAPRPGTYIAGRSGSCVFPVEIPDATQIPLRSGGWVIFVRETLSRRAVSFNGVLAWRDENGEVCLE